MGVLGRVGGVLGSSWRRLGTFWGVLGAFSLVCVAILDGFGWIGWTFNVF